MHELNVRHWGLLVHYTYKVCWTTSRVLHHPIYLQKAVSLHTTCMDTWLNSYMKSDPSYLPLSCRLELAALVLWSLLIHSLPAHKEFRFLLPALCLMMPYCGKALEDLAHRFKAQVAEEEEDFLKVMPP